VPTIEPAVFARLMKLPHAARADLLECVAATGMPPRQIENLVDSLLREVKEKHLEGVRGEEMQ